MIDVLRIAHLRIAPQEGNLEVGNCEGNRVCLCKHTYTTCVYEEVNLVQSVYVYVYIHIYMCV